MDLPVTGLTDVDAQESGVNRAALWLIAAMGVILAVGACELCQRPKDGELNYDAILPTVW